MSIQKKPYEISIWEDVVIYVGTDSNNQEIESSNLFDLATVEYQYYSERKLAVIGSSTMTSPARTTNNVFKRNINGVETLTFDMYYQYEDIDEGQIVHNPLINLVIDERKVKLYYDNKWYDFIVKKDDEKGRDYKYSYTCTGLAANELGKTGFRIELDTELENNTGTVQELGAAVLEGSDWQLAQSGQEVIQQTNDEALYLIKLNSEITGTIRGTSSTEITIDRNSFIYVYYTSYANQVEDYFQFIYVDKSNGAGTPDLYEDNITIYCTNTAGGTYDLYMNGVSWNNEKPSFEDTKTVSNYRGRRYVRKQLMDYDPVLEQTVYKYTKPSDGNKIYYGYTTTEYLDAQSVTNYIYNSTDFRGTSYWSGYNSTSLEAKVHPDVKPAPVDPDSNLFNAYLIVKFGDITGRAVNEGIIQNYSRINKFEKGEKYRFKVWVGTKNNNNEIVATSIPFKCIIKKYTTIDVDNESDVKYFEFNGNGTADDGYRYIDATCAQSATWRELNSNVGIFLYPRENGNLNEDYYIKNIQLYRYIEDENGNVMDIGDVPEVRIVTNYHFYDPAVNAGLTSAEDYKFSDNDKSLYTPLYGSGVNEFEKVRSITAKESNRFNLLQELSETFQCWVRFEIAHESNGQISIESYDYYKPVEITSEQWQPNTYYIYNQITKVYQLSTDYDSNKKYFKPVTRKRQSKKVIFYGEILQDNFVGFKYGINLKDNNRTLDSEQIVTKIIVKDNTCDVANNGFCSIARAQDNPIRENFALNLDYYTSQGLINSSNLNNDLYLELNGSIGLYPKLSRYNKERNQLIETQALEANSINRLTADYQAAEITYNEATKELSKLLDPVSGTIVQYTGYQYEDFTNQCTREVDSNGWIPAYKSEVYFIKTALTAVTPNTGTITYYIKKPVEETTPVSGTNYFTLENNHFKAYTNTKFSSTQTYYKQVDAQYTANTYFQTAADTTKLKLTGSSSEVYIYAAARRIMQLDGNDLINDNYTIQKVTEVVTLTKEKDKAYTDMNKVKTDLDEVQADYDSIKAKLVDIAKSTEEIEKEFNTKYSRYIQEGSWTDDNYMDDDLYYLDSLDVLYQSAYPKVSYNFKVLELSQLEGYEAYKFDIGNKTFVEDTEFFGYQIIDGLRTPARETVVVTEAVIDLDNADKNDLKVQNYKSHFEDLFQRITAATQNLEYHSGEYGRAAAAVSPDGTISQTVLQKSLATAAYIIQNSRDQSVVWDDTGIQATNLNDPLQVTRLASGGLLVSSDGGQTWGVAISGYGINANYLNVGTIDADKINIMSGTYPTFKWDALGLRAYAFETDDNGITIRSYDPTRFVAHDRFGIYGLSGSLVPPTLNTVSDVEENANFALTWNGLFIKSSHRDGYVRVSPTEDITLHSTLNDTDIIRGKFGLLGENSSGEEIYGLALYGPELDENNNLIPTVETKSDGTLWLKSQMDIGDQSSNSIYIGVGQEATTAEKAKYGNTHGKKIFTVHGAAYSDDTGEAGGSTTIDRFTVYEDGFITSRGSYISGPINVTEGGTIGNMTVAGLVDTVGVRISPSGTEFKYNGTQATPTANIFIVTHGFDGTPTYQWYLGSNPSSLSPITGAISDSYNYTFDASDFQNGIAYLKVDVTYAGDTYSDRITLSYVVDGQQGPPGPAGESGDTYQIRTDVGEVLKFVNTNSSYSNKIYEFSITNLQFYAINNLTFEPISTSNLEYPYVDLDIKILSYNLKDIIKPENYSIYISKVTGDLVNYYFNLQALYNNLTDENQTLKSHLLDTYTSIEKDEIIQNLISYFGDIVSVDIIIYGTLHKENGDELYIEKYLLMKNGLSEEMLNFSINAGSLNTAIQNTKLHFDAEGLIITNGGFKIYTQNQGNEEPVFYIDPYTHQLVMVGNGTFTGTIYAQDGSFNGEITAASGNIGGFNIEEFKLSTAGLILESAHDQTESSIYAQNITLGTGAQIEKYLNIGNLSLLNPQYNENLDNSVLKLSNDNNIYFQLTNDGYIIGNNWSIKPEAGYNGVVAKFDQLIAQNGQFSGTVYATDGSFTGEVVSSVISASTINTANFVTSNTRAMGGSYIFKPTFKIISIVDKGSNILELELENIGDYFNITLDQSNEYIVAISGGNTTNSLSNTIFGKIHSLNDISESKVQIEFIVNGYTTLKASDALNRYQTLTLLGKANNDLLIGINSDDNSNGNILPPRALAMESFSTLSDIDGNGDIDYTLKLLLGDLSILSTYDLGFQNLSGYGLYADNVYLRGSLITRSTEGNTFAGVNTQRDIPFNYNVWSGSNNSEYNNDKIVFWGGANGYSENAIQASPFIVTDKGNIFARSGEFKGSVISDSVITQSIIKAPIIYGSDDDPLSPSLKIYDTHTDRGGISFYKKVGEIDQENILNDTEDEETLNISINGFIHKNNSFISFDDTNNYILYNGTQYSAGSTILKSQELSDGNAKLALNSSSYSKLSYNTTHGIEITDSGINNFGGFVENEGNMLVYTQGATDNAQELNYKVMNGYYCLFVKGGV